MGLFAAPCLLRCDTKSTSLALLFSLKPIRLVLARIATSTTQSAATYRTTKKHRLLGYWVCVTPFIEQASTAYWAILFLRHPFFDQASAAYWVFHVFVKPLIDPASTASCVFYVYVNPVIDLASTAYWVFYVHVNPLINQASTAGWVFTVHVNPIMDQASTAYWVGAYDVGGGVGVRSIDCVPCA